MDKWLLEPEVDEHGLPKSCRFCRMWQYDALPPGEGWVCCAGPECCLVPDGVPPSQCPFRRLRQRGSQMKA